MCTGEFTDNCLHLTIHYIPWLLSQQSCFNDVNEAHSNLPHSFFFPLALNLIIAPLKTHSKVFWFRAGTKSHGRSKWIHPKKKNFWAIPSRVVKGNNDADKVNSCSIRTLCQYPVVLVQKIIWIRRLQIQYWVEGNIIWLQYLQECPMHVFCCVCMSLESFRSYRPSEKSASWSVCDSVCRFGQLDVTYGIASP